MANPSRKDAINNSRKQRKRTETRKSKQVGTQKEVTPSTPSTPSSPVSKQPSSAQVKERGEQNGKAARQSRKQTIFPKAKMGDRKGKGGGNYGTTDNGLVAAETAGVTLKTFDAASLGAEDFSQPAANLTGLTIKEATSRRTLIAKQKNELDVMYDKYALIKRGYEVEDISHQATAAGVKAKKSEVQVGTEVLGYQEALVKYDIAESKLEQAEELLIQQQDATAGTKLLTEPLRIEWQLKLEQQETKNEGLQLQIQQSKASNIQRQLQVEADIINLQLYDVEPQKLFA